VPADQQQRAKVAQFVTAQDAVRLVRDQRADDVVLGGAQMALDRLVEDLHQFRQTRLHLGEQFGAAHADCGEAGHHRIAGQPVHLVAPLQRDAEHFANDGHR